MRKAQQGDTSFFDMEMITKIPWPQLIPTSAVLGESSLSEEPIRANAALIEGVSTFRCQPGVSTH